LIIITFIITAIVIAFDQISKYYIRTNMSVGESFNFIPGFLNIRYIENAGASFGILAEHRWVFMSFSTIAIILMVGAVFYLNKKDLKKYNRLASIALGLMLGGGVGNMIDRTFNVSEVREGVRVVVDFLEFDFVNFAIFNIADVFITVGAALFFVCILAGKYKTHDKKEQAEEIEELNGVLDISEDTGENL